MAAPWDQHLDDCNVYVHEGDGCYDLDESRECTCGLVDTPIIYKGSHVYPGDDVERDGVIDIAYVAPHCGPNGTYLEENEDGPPPPYLRFGVNEGTVVLEPTHVRQIIETLTHWLDAIAPAP
jgi:hypothetical protein